MLAILDGETYDCVIVDHYALDKTWESAVRVITDKIMVIDDLLEREHDCDLLLNQNYFNTKTKHWYLDRLPVATHYLLGPKFALLQPEYSKLRNKTPIHEGLVRRVLVFFGASDPANNTKKVLQVLSSDALKFLAVDVVLGSNYSDLKAISALASKRGNTFLYQAQPSLSELMARSDLIIGAGGATTWERMCLRKPALVISVAENQEAHAASLASDGYQVYLSNKQRISCDDWLQAITRLIRDNEEVKKLAVKAGQLVDGEGCNRVVQALLSRLCNSEDVYVESS